MDLPADKPFQLYAGHPALDLVNTLDLRFTSEPVEKLPAYSHLLRFVTQLGLLSAEQARRLGRSVRQKEASGVLTSVVELREALSAVLYALLAGNKSAPAQFEILEKHFHAASVERTLYQGKARLEWRWPSTQHRAQLPLWMLAQSAADLLISHDCELIKDCGDPTCRWLFLDVSKNHTRRWCDMKTCGNRMKARRHQARLLDAAL